MMERITQQKCVFTGYIDLITFYTQYLTVKYYLK